MPKLNGYIYLPTSVLLDLLESAIVERERCRHDILASIDEWNQAIKLVDTLRQAILQGVRQELRFRFSAKKEQVHPKPSVPTIDIRNSNIGS